MSNKFMVMNNFICRLRMEAMLVTLNPERGEIVNYTVDLQHN